MSQQQKEELESKEQHYKHPWDALDVDYIVSVDFGSSGFAAAFCPLGVPSHQRMIADWSDNRAAAELNKNLAALLIDAETKETLAVGYEAQELYSKSKESQQQDKYMYFEHFKPYLYSRDHLEKNIPIPSAGGKYTLPLADLITKSLESVISHALNYINQLNTLAGIDLVTKAKIFWVLSVPAIWDEMSKEMMKFCARKAGMMHFELGSEPIASTFHVLNCQGRKFKLRMNDRVMILDIGGGTVDVACITVESNKYELSELHHGDGIRAGGLDVDVEFMEQLLADLLPDDIIQTIKTKQPHQWIRQKQEFVAAKFSVPLELSSDEAWNVPFCFGINNLMSKKKKKKAQFKKIKRHINQYQIIDYESENKQQQQQVSGAFKLGRSNLKISKKGWLHLHEKVFTKIFTFVRELFHHGEVSACDKVIVVGGFANSKYLLDRLMREFPRKEFFTPRQPHLAVVKGALYWICQRRLLNKTRAKYSYGIAIDKKFNPHMHPENRRKMTCDGPVVENAFNMLVSRNEQYQDGYKERFHYYIPAGADHLEIVLYASEDTFCQYVFDEDGQLPTTSGRRCFQVKKFTIPIENPSNDRVRFQIDLEYNQNGINLSFVDPNDGESKLVQVDTQARPGSNI